MPTIQSQINPNSSEFKDNQAFNLEVVADLQNLVKRISLGWWRESTRTSQKSWQAISS